MNFIQITGIIVLIIILLFILRVIFKKTPEKYYKKASKCHKQGEKYHKQGDEELAKDYYGEADHYRKKAQELENVV